MPAHVSAQSLFGDSGFSSSHGSYNSVPYEHVDPLSGNLIVVVNDLALPGNAGLNLHVTRSYNSKFHRDFENGDYTLDERTPLGVGWRLHFGRVLHADSTQPGETVIETPDGGGQTLYQSAGGHGWMSKSFWRYDRATNTAYVPNGLRYVFGYVGETSGPRGRVLYVTEVRDPFDNVITFEYSGNGSLPGSISRIRQHLSPTQIREVLFDYNGNGSLKTMAYDGRVWSYEYDAVPALSSWVLRRVVPPIGLRWEYVYGDTGVGPELTGLRPPGGGTMDYTYATRTRRASSLTQSSRVVVSRATGGTRITPGTWTFNYDQGPNQDWTVVDCPCGTTSYRYSGIGTDPNGNFSAWKSGVLLERTIKEPGSGTVLEHEAITYQPSVPISNDPVTGQGGIWSDPAVYQPLVTSRVLTRGPQFWTTTFQYHTTNYNDFGRAWRINVTGDQARTTELIYDYNFASHWIINGPIEDRVSIGAHVRTRGFTYNAQGFLTRSNTYGVVVDYEPNAAGEVAKVKDAHNHDTTFTYSWGVLANTVTPLLTASRAINPDGTVQSETAGTSLTTSYVYDAGGRLRRVRPPTWPNVNEIVYEYDDVTTYFVRTSRGTSQTEELLDGFGRVMSTSTNAGVKTKVERDACGRVTFASAPYTGAAPTRGTTTTYDALGRTKTVTAPGTPTSTTTYAYIGADVEITDAEGRLTKYNYDAFSGPGDARLMRVTDATNTNTDYQYDVLGGLTRVTGPGPGPIRTWTYNTRGELVSETQPESGTTSYVYDSTGLLTQTTNHLNQTTTLTYDQNDRLTGRDALGSASDVTITYDALGRVQQQTIEGVVTTFGYDTAGRPSSRTDGIDPNMTFTSLYGYDANDNLTSTTYPLGRVVTYQYDAAFRLTNVLNNGQSFASAFSYDTSGRLMSYYTGAVQHTIGYDDRDRVRELTAGVASGSTPLWLTYSYDKVSNVMSIADTRTGVPAQTQTYTYDVLNRMKTANGSWGAIEWSYDAAGNRLTEIRPAASTVYNYDGANRLTHTSGQGAESFTWTGLGQLATNTRGTATTIYNYTPAGMLKEATAPGLTASYLYDTDHLRVKRTVNGRTSVTVRSFGGQVLSEFETCGGPPAWSRDNIYAGSRLLGAARANVALPTIEFEAASSNAAEAAGSAAPRVRLTTANGAPLACAVSVKYKTQNGTASDQHDYAAIADQTLTFQPGTASGTVLPVPSGVTIHNDPYYEPGESFVVELSAGTGAALGAQATHTVSIQDNDAPPTVSVSVVPGYGTVSENAGWVRFRLTLTERTGYRVRVTAIAMPDTAQAGTDYVGLNDFAFIEPMTTERELWIQVVDDAWAEPLASETFYLDIGTPVHAGLGTGRAIGTIVDDEPPRAPIDLTKQGAYFADCTSLAGQSDYIVVGNHNEVPITVRLTFTRKDGSGLTRDVALAAKGRYGFRVGDEPGLGTHEVSLAVQSLTSGSPVMADHVVYEGSGWEAGRGTEGVAPAHAWWFPEGSVGYFDEWITVFNPTDGPVNVWFSLMGPSGGLYGTTVPIPTGPGRIKVNVRDWLPGGGDHGTQIVAYKPDGVTTSPIVVERTMFWQSDRREAHSSPGTSSLSMNWYFAEGSTGFATYLTLLNPYSYATPTTVQYLHENGSTYSESITVPAFSRATIPAPAWLPMGSFGYRIMSTVVPVAAERSMYGGTNWTVGTAGVGIAAPATTWVFQEGATGTFWDTYILLANPSSTQASVWLALRPDSGSAIVWHNVLVPANSRRSVHVNFVPGMPGTVFRTEVISDQPVVAERVTYWPGASSGMMAMESGGDPPLLGTNSANAIGSASLSPRVNLSPYTTLRRAVPVNLYQTLTPGEPAGPVERALAEQTLKNEAIDGEIFQATPFDASSMTTGSTWYGGHLTGGRRP